MKCGVQLRSLYVGLSPQMWDFVSWDIYLVLVSIILSYRNVGIHAKPGEVY